MLARLLLAGALAAAAPTPGADTELEVLVAEAVDLVEREAALVPLAAPANSESPDFETHRAELGAVERAGAAVLVELQSLDLTLSAAIVDTLRGPGPAGSPTRRPPAPPVYAAAQEDLRALVSATGADDAPAAGPSSTATSGATPDATSMRSSGLPIPVAAAVLSAVVGGAWFALRRRKRHLDEALDQAMVDPLTSVPNRRRLEVDLDASRDRRRSVAVLMVDIDHFKQVNDVHGHQVGDDVLRRVGSVLPSAVRAGDVVYRYGGEEFCVLLPDATLVEAQAIAERIRRAVGEIELPSGEPITASVGVADGIAASARASIARADRALYEAKRSGRDRIAVSA